MKENIRKWAKPFFIVAAVTIVLLLAMLFTQRRHNRLPETPGVALFISFSEGTEGRSYQEIERRGYAHMSFAGEKIWLSQKEYEDFRRVYGFPTPKIAPLSVWGDAGDIKTFIVDGNIETKLLFAVREDGDVKMESIAVRRWPAYMIGTEAVRENAWTGREKIDHVWHDGGIFGLSKGSIVLEPGYLYSIYVMSSYGWDEFSFVTRVAE